ncbi:hypothetical protein JTE90_017334 [Oedothorax gibbosus]|uniref:Transposase Tc1-like domain-containing protein n=1 Tax=Oedothorax gibbosus TaxID=931172 RepID=A0AAV6UC16_9ARAC|nr:hypothetical protein JTE90_017334 [Oedothorax gibbosus]
MGRSLRDISSDLKYPKSTVAYVIKKWKVTGDRRNVPRVGRPTKLGDRDRRVLSIEIWKNRTQPMALIREEHQQASGSIVSMNTIRKEAHLLGFHGHAAAHKPLITEFNLAARLMWCKHIEIGPYRSVETGSLERRIKVHPLPFGWQGMDLASAWRTSPARMHCANSQVRWRWNYSLGCFSGMDWDLWSPFMDDNASCHVSKLTKAWYGANGVHRMDWPAQTPIISRTSGRATSPNSGVHYSSKIGEGTFMSSPSRVEENTTSCHTKTSGKYAPKVHSVIASRGGSINY